MLRGLRPLMIPFKWNKALLCSPSLNGTKPPYEPPSLNGTKPPYDPPSLNGTKPFYALLL